MTFRTETLDNAGRRSKMKTRTANQQQPSLREAAAAAMQIQMTASFTSRCHDCGSPIEKGTKFLWEKSDRFGSHLDCSKVERLTPTAQPTFPTPQPHTMNARFGGTCANCHRSFDAGDPIQYLRPDAFHAGCPAVKGPDPRETGLDLIVLPYGSTRYAVEQDGEWVFIRIDHIAPQDAQGRPQQWGGNLYVKQQTGPNHRRIGRQVKGQTYVGDFAAAIEQILAAPEHAARQYGLQLGRCSVCDSDLTNPISRELGIGPVCRKRFDWSMNKPVFPIDGEVDAA